jgi:hypothetical protein
MNKKDCQEISSSEEKKVIIDKAYSLIYEKITHKKIIDRNFILINDKNKIEEYINDESYFIIENNICWKGKEHFVHGTIFKCSALHLRIFIKNYVDEDLNKKYIILPDDHNKPVIVITEDGTFLVYNVPEMEGYKSGKSG